MRRIRRASKLLVPLFLCGACSDDGAPRRAQAPVILISLDTLRSDRLTPYGAPSRNSPYLQRLASESAVFTDCVAQSSFTGPSHRSLFTGQFVHRHGQDGNQQLEGPYTLASLLRDTAYQTAAFTGGGYLDARFGLDQGFSTFDAGDVRTEGAKAGTTRRRGFRHALPAANEWLAARSLAAPYFLFLHTYDIHCPYWPEEPWRADFGGSYDGNLKLATFCGENDFKKVHNENRSLPAGDLDYLESMYDGCIAMTDDMLGAFLDKLRADGTLDECLLIVTSDHGESLGENEMIGHMRMYETQLQVPLLIRFPGGEFAGVRNDEPVMLIDVLPTILDYVGVDVPDGVQGHSLLPVLSGAKTWSEAGAAERTRLAQVRAFKSARFDNRWKIAWKDGSTTQLQRALFDLQSDPREENNLATTPAGQQHFSALHARYLEFLDDTREEDAQWRSWEREGAVDVNLERQLAELGYVDEE